MTGPNTFTQSREEDLQQETFMQAVDVKDREKPEQLPAIYFIEEGRVGINGNLITVDEYETKWLSGLMDAGSEGLKLEEVNCEEKNIKKFIAYTKAWRSLRDKINGVSDDDILSSERYSDDEVRYFLRAQWSSHDELMQDESEDYAYEEDIPEHFFVDGEMYTEDAEQDTAPNSSRRGDYSLIRVVDSLETESEDAVTEEKVADASKTKATYETAQKYILTGQNGFKHSDLVKDGIERAWWDLIADPDSVLSKDMKRRAHELFEVVRCESSPAFTRQEETVDKRAQPKHNVKADRLVQAIGSGAANMFGEDARCSDADPEAFFPEKGGSTREAKRICAVCPVQQECLDYALSTDQRFGIWGGMSERERQRLKRLSA